MNDLVINAIQQNNLTSNNLTFKSLRNLAGIDMNAQSQLNRGRAIIHCPSLLNQYLYSYGPMVQRQWTTIVPEVIEMLNDNNHDIHVFDYGCGQGLGTLLLLENTIGLKENIKQLTLIEPSKVALERASRLLSCKLPPAEIYIVNKDLDEVEDKDFNFASNNTNLHLFSNILDVEGFNQFDLFNKIRNQNGEHFFIAVSNDRNCYGGTTRLQELYDALLKLPFNKSKKFKVKHSKFEQFTDHRNMNHVYFALKIEIS